MQSWNFYRFSSFLRFSDLKGLSHQFESGNKWYGWKEQKQEKSRLSILKIFNCSFDF
jgi:hypothetical protein